MTTGVLTLLVPISAIIFGNALAFGIVYFAIKTRNSERMALIERGATPEEVFASRRISRHAALKNGLFLIGIAIGLLVACIVSATTSINETTAYFAFTMLFGGLGLIIFYVIYSRYERNHPRNDF